MMPDFDPLLILAAGRRSVACPRSRSAASRTPTPFGQKRNCDHNEWRRNPSNAVTSR